MKSYKNALCRTLALVAFAAIAAATWAIPAKPGLIEVKMADGTTIKVRIVGDEWGHYYLSEDGYLLTRGARAGEGVFIGKDGVRDIARKTALGAALEQETQKVRPLAAARRVRRNERIGQDARKHRKTAETVHNDFPQKICIYLTTSAQKMQLSEKSKAIICDFA